MKPTEELMEEHLAIKAMLAIMENIADRLDSGEQIDPEKLKQIPEFIHVYADSCHHAKEEGLLFKELEAAGMPAEGGPLTVMLQEHEMGRVFVVRLADAIDRFKRGDAGAGAEVAENMRNYIGLLGLHMDKEDQILYPLADERLSPEAQNRLTEGFDRIEEEVIGSGRHEEFQSMIQEYQNTYLRG